MAAGHGPGQLRRGHPSLTRSRCSLRYLRDILDSPVLRTLDSPRSFCRTRRFRWSLNVSQNINRPHIHSFLNSRQFAVNIS